MAFVTAEAVALAAEPGHGALGKGGSGDQDLLPLLDKPSFVTYDGERVILRRGRPPGRFLYGPFWQLAGGHYRLRVRCSASGAGSDAPVLGVEVIALGRFQQAWRDFSAAELAAGPIALAFAVPPDLALESADEVRFEFRLSHFGNAGLCVSAVALERLGEGLPVSEPRRWRLSGWLQNRGGIGPPREVVRVPRSERPGCVLALPRPYLSLPAGSYRLAFRCRAGRAHGPADPVLGVEVVARGRWLGRPRGGWRTLLDDPAPAEVQLAWRDFTGPELSQDVAFVDFSVPRELGLEAGDRYAFDIRFLHLGNAALDIGAVELRQWTKGGESPPEWRLRGRLGSGLGRPRPPLRLPSDAYRLALSGKLVARPGIVEPVLDVAVLALGRGLNRRPDVLVRERLTAAELTAGAAVDFAVPAEAGRESGGGRRIGFRLDPVGGGLVLDALTLRGTPARPALLGDRRLKVIVVGNCQALIVHEALLRSPDLNARISARYHFVGLQKALQDEGRRELAACDMLLVQEIRDWEDYPLRDAIPDAVPIIKFPLLFLASLWPFDHHNGRGDRDAYDREWPNLTFPYLDGLLGRLRREIPDREARFAAYRDLAVDGLINHVRLHDFESRRLQAMDRTYGFGIGRFILDNFQRRRLFYTINHPNRDILGLLVQHVVRRLGIAQPYRPPATLDHLSRLQVPLHPRVARALGVAWADETTLYTYAGRQITWEAYTRAYIDHYG